MNKFNIDNLNEVVRPEWGEIAEQFDTDSFAELTLNLWQNEDYCKAKGAKAFLVAKGYLWDNLSEIQNNFYHNVIGNKV